MRMKSELSQRQVLLILDSESEIAVRFPEAHNILKSLSAGGYRISEINSVPAAIQIVLGGGAILMVYTKSGKVVVQGNATEFGASGQALARTLGKKLIWQN